MNGRERLFFRNIELHKSMSYRKREDKENVDKMRDKFAKELMKQQEIKANKMKKYNSVFYRLIMYILK